MTCLTVGRAALRGAKSFGESAMLKFYRKHIKSVIWLIVLSFVIWGVGTLSSSKETSSAYVGSVEGKKVSHKEFQSILRYYELLNRAHVAQATSEKKPGEDESEKSKDRKAENEKESAEALEPPKLLSWDELRGLTWQAIVLARQAERQRMIVTDRDVRKEIERLFSSGEAFNPSFYESWIRDHFRGRPRDFEEAVRTHLAGQKLREMVLRAVPEKERDGRWMGWLITTMSRAHVKDFSSQPETSKDQEKVPDQLPEFKLEETADQTPSQKQSESSQVPQQPESP